MVETMCLCTNMILFIRQQSQRVSFSSTNCHYNALHPYFITGFTDGEGCFHISIYRDSRMVTGWHVKPVFKITLHQRDRALLELIRTSLGVGQIYKHGKYSIQLRVSSVKDLLVIIGHFDKYPLITQKFLVYILFQWAGGRAAPRDSSPLPCKLYSAPSLQGMDPGCTPSIHLKGGRGGEGGRVL
jgi:hypothetical protein